MAEHKLTIYLKGAGKAIVITDKNKCMNVGEVKEKITELMTKKQVVAIFETADDFITIKSEDVSGIMFSAPGQIIEEGTSIKQIVQKKLDKTHDHSEKKILEELVELNDAIEISDEEPETEKEDIVNTKEVNDDYEQILVIESK